jgi:hypothetical protein
MIYESMQMSGTMDAVSRQTLQEEANRIFPIWAADHKSDFIDTIPSDPNDEHQDISIVEFEAQPSLEIAAQIGYMGLGAVSETIVGDLQRLGIVDLVKRRTHQKKNTLISSIHLTSVLDAAASHNQLFVASDDEEFANNNVLIANPMLAWTTIKGAKTMFALRKAGRVIRGIPRDGAEKYELSNKLVNHVDRLAAPVMVDVFNQGNVIHRAPSGTRGRKILLADGSQAICVPRVEDLQARTIRKRTNVVIGMPMDVQGENTVGVVLAPREIEKDDDVHTHMEEMVDTINGLTDYNTVYGMPDGATLLNV